MSYKRKKASKFLKFTEGVFEKAVDAVLVTIYFNLEAPRFIRSDRRWMIDREVDKDFENFNYQDFKRAVNYLRRHGLVQAGKDLWLLPKITETGRQRANSLIPEYVKDRIWDGRIYLITYDLPVDKNKERNYLREFMRKIGCGMLQKSVWMTPYNPKKLIDDLVKEKNLEELIIVSSVGKDGSVGSFDLKDLIERVYHLVEINSRYRQLLFEYKENKLSKNQYVFQFISILKEDPQLPFELLPEEWVGEDAYVIYKKLTKQ